MGRYIFWVLGNRSLQLLVTLSSQLLLARYFIPEEFGSFAVLFASLSLWQMVFSLRLPLQILQSSAMDRGLYWNAALQEAFVVSVASGGIALATVGYSLELILLLAGQYVGRLVDVCKAFEERLCKQERVLHLDTACTIGSTGLTLLLAIQGMGPWILALRELLAACLLLPFLFPRGERPFFLALSSWRDLFRSGIPLWGDALFEQGLSRFCILLAHAVGGVYGAGIYFQAQRLVSMPHLYFCSLLSRYALFRFARGDPHILFSFYAWLLPPLILGTSLLMWTGKEWVVIALGSAWAGSSELLQGMASAILFMTLFSLHKMKLIAQKQTRSLLYARLFQIAGIAIPLLLFPKWGLFAIGVGFSLGYAFAFLSTCHTLYFFTYLRHRLFFN